MLKLITRTEIQRRLNISKSQFYKLRKLAGFPKPICLPKGSRCKRYLASDLENFLNSLIRDQNPSGWIAST